METSRLSVKISNRRLDKLRQLAKEKETTMTNYLSNLIDNLPEPKVSPQQESENIYNTELSSYVLEQLNKIESFPINWDNYGTLPISKTAINVARRIVTDTKITPMFLLEPKFTGIKLHYFDRKNTLVLTIHPSSQIDYILTSNSDNTGQGGCNIGGFKAYELINNMELFPYIVPSNHGVKINTGLTSY